MHSYFILNKIFKKSVYYKISRNIKLGQKVMISILFRNTNRRMRIVTYKGFISKISTNKKNLYIQLKQVIFGYSFFIRFKINSANLVRVVFV